MFAIAYADPLVVRTSTFPEPHQVYSAAGNSEVKLSRPGTASSSGRLSVVANPVSSSSPSTDLVNDSCTGLFSPPVIGLATAIAPELRKLAQYEQLCNGNLVNRSSFFVPTPITVAAAASDASDAATKLIEYASFGIKPLVFMEPDTDNGTNIDLNLYQAGAYDSALDAYFADLKADGVTDAMMGMWVILPEGNMPIWTTDDPATYSADVVKTIQFQKKYFPSSLSAILLNSESYPSASSWSGGSYSSLLPYLQGIPTGLVDSFGLQGFPWAPPADQLGAADYDPSVYLPTNLASEAAKALGISSIWFNTGTFNQMYTQNSAETVTLQPLQRQGMLNGVLAQAKALQAQGFSVAIHLFAQNKSNTSEADDWSYWQTSPNDGPGTAVFTTFVHQAAEANIPLWLFDTYDQ